MTGANQREERRLLALCDDVLVRARKVGATDAEVYAEHVVQSSATIEQSEIKAASLAEHEAVGIRVLVGDRQGFAYVNRLDDASLDEAVRDAIAFAKASPGDPGNGLVAPEGARPVDGLWDDALATQGPDDCVDVAARLIDAARAVDRRVSIDGGSASTSVARAAIATTTGVRASASETGASYGVSGMALQGDDVGAMDSRYEAVRRADAIDARKVARRFGEEIVALLGPVDGPTYKGKVLFSNEAFEDVFLDALLAAVDGDAVVKGKSRLKEKLGQRIAAPGFVLVDDGTLPGEIGSSSFDREGLPHRRCVLVGDGVLHRFMYDGRAARRAGKRSTGHAAGSARSLPSIGTTNLRVMPGDAADADLVRAVGDGLFVRRFSGDVDGVSGDFSGVAKCSFRVEGGELGRPVKETLIAGNVFDLLEKIVALGAVAHREMTTLCPWVLVDGVDVTAGA